MKHALRCCFIIVAILQDVCSALESGDALINRLRTTMLEAENTVAIISKEIVSATPEERGFLVAAIRQIIDDAFKASPPWSSENNCVIAASAEVLRTISDEDAIVAGFASRLDRIPPDADCETVVIHALGRCRNPVAAEAIANLARLRLKELTPWFPEPPASITEEQKNAIDAETVSFLHAIEGLARSTSLSGKTTARELSDKYVKLFEGSRYREYIREHFERRINRLLPEKTQPSYQRSSAGGAVSPMSFKQPMVGTPAPMSVPNQTRLASKVRMAVAAVIGSMLVLGFLIWFLRKK